MANSVQKKFWLIQRGRFNGSRGTFLFGREGSIALEYMGSAEFQYGAIPKALRRLMGDFPEYKIFQTGIFTPEKDELLVFCREKYSEPLIGAIRDFIAHPYQLKEHSELEKVPKARGNDTSFTGRRTNFWWSIDKSSDEKCGDWMALLASSRQIFEDSISNEYNEWWLKKPPEEREKEYKDSLR